MTTLTVSWFGPDPEAEIPEMGIPEGGIKDSVVYRPRFDGRPWRDRTAPCYVALIASRGGDSNV